MSSICLLVLAITYLSIEALGQELDVASDTRIVGGYVAKPGEFPYQVSMQMSGRHFCGGSIIHKRYILTASHCFLGPTADKTTVVTGTNLLNAGGDSYEAEKFIAHAEFDSNNLINDIGLVKLARDIVFRGNVKQIDIAHADVGVGEDLLLSGWGITSYPGKTPNELQAIHLQSIENEKCAEELVEMSTIQDTHLCTYNKQGEGACHGDSGGPLAFNGSQVGVVSWGYPCAKGKPDVFTRVMKYKNWIQQSISY